MGYREYIESFSLSFDGFCCDLTLFVFWWLNE